MPAKKSINLLPKEDYSQTFWGKALSWTLTIGRYIVIVTELIVVIAFLFRFKYDMQLASVEEQITDSQQIISSYQDLENQFRFLQKRVSAVSEIVEQDYLSSDLYQAITTVTPQDVSFQNLSFNDTTLSMEGIALSDVGLITLLNFMKESPSFDQISLNSLSTKGERDPTLEFSITADLK